MTKSAFESLAATAFAVLPLLFAGSAEAGCNCRGNAGANSTPVPMMAHPAPMMHAPMMHAPRHSMGMMAGPSYGAPGPGSYGPGAYVGTTGPVWQGGNTPPGTLGKTYRLCSRPLPEDEHPRNAGLEIRIADAETVDVERMEGFHGEDGLWHFTTAKPWLPTQPAIVRVVIGRMSGGAMVKDVRVVRLIPGRILTVEF